MVKPLIVHINFKIHWKELITLKKQVKQNEKDTEERQEELQTINDISKSENGQPVPQPKDYDEIEY